MNSMNRLVEEIAFDVNIEGRPRQGKTGREVAHDDTRRAQSVILIERLADAVGHAAAGQNEDGLIARGRLPFEFGGEIAETPMPPPHGARRYLDLRRFRLRRKEE